MEESVFIAIKSGLSLIETCLRDVLQQTRTDSETGRWLLKERSPDLGDHSANEVAKNAEKMLAEIRELQRVFDIAKNTESPRWRILNDLNQIWSTLSELSEDRLKAYFLSKMEAVRKDMERVVSG